MLQSWTLPWQTMTFHVHLLLEKPVPYESCTAAWAGVQHTRQSDKFKKGYRLPGLPTSVQLQGIYSHKGICLCLAHIC